MDPGPPTHLIPLHTSISCKILSWNMAEGERVRKGTVLCGYTQELGDDSDSMEGKLQLKSSVVGVVKELLVQPGEVVPPGWVQIEPNPHHTQPPVLFPHTTLGT